MLIYNFTNNIYASRFIGIIATSKIPIIEIILKYYEIWNNFQILISI